MKSFIKFLMLNVVLLLPVASFAGRNPAVQPLFFEQLQAALPSSQPEPITTSGAVSDVTWQGLAWEVDNVKTSHVPIVIEFYSDDSGDCQRFNPVGTDECAPQLAQFDSASSSYGDNVKFIRFNVRLHPDVVNGPDVRVLPTHFFIADYTDTQHYTAVKVWGMLDEAGIAQVIQQTFNISQ